MSDEHIICAIDGGGTGCRVWIARVDGTVLATARGGPANVATAPEKSIENITEAVASASVVAGLKDLENVVAHAGLAGVMEPSDAQKVRARLPFRTCGVSDDRLTSALGALGTRDGVLLSVGTGAFAAVRHGGEIAYFGGWGFAVGDQASGGWIGRTVLEQTLLAVDGLRAESDLTRAILARFDNRPSRLVAFAIDAAPVDFGVFAPMVVEAATGGDPVARSVMQDGAAYLDACLQRGSLAGDDVICLVGGVASHYAPYLDAKFHHRICEPDGTALDGAVHLARQLAAQREALT